MAVTMMKTKASRLIEHCQIGLIVATGIVSLALVWRSQDGLSVAVMACYVAYGILFLVGALAYYIRPRIGSAILIVSILSSIVIAPLVGFPVWVNGSVASRIGLILGAFISAGIVSGPLLNSSDKCQE